MSYRLAFALACMSYIFDEKLILISTHIHV